MNAIHEIGWHLYREIPETALRRDEAYAAEQGLDVHEVAVRDREGRPVTVRWVTTPTGALLSAYEIERTPDIIMHTWYNHVSPRPGYHYAEKISPRTFADDMVQNREWGETVHFWTGLDRSGQPLSVTWLTHPAHGFATLYAYETKGGA